MAHKSKNSTKTAIRYERFALEYMKHLNGSEAALAAGYAKKGAGQTAYRLLKNPQILSLLEEFRAKLRERSLLTIELIDTAIANGISANMADYIEVQEDGSAVVNLSGLDRAQMAPIQSVDVKEYTEGRAGKAEVGEDGKPKESKQRTVKNTTLRLVNKPQMIEIGAKRLGLLKDKVEVEVHDKRAEMIARARARVVPQIQAPDTPAKPESIQ